MKLKLEVLEYHYPLTFYPYGSYCFLSVFVYLRFSSLISACYFKVFINLRFLCSP